MADDGHSDLTVALAFFAGALAGAGIALLLAPKTGSELRAQVGEWMREMQERAGDAMGHGGEEEAPDAEEPAVRGSRASRKPSAV